MLLRNLSNRKVGGFGSADFAIRDSRHYYRLRAIDLVQLDDAMKPIIYAPDATLRAYCDLLTQVFFFLRGCNNDKVIDGNLLFDLADAMHNIAGIVVDYGGWTDDEGYRRLYLRPFDEKWRDRCFGLESFLELRLREHQANA